ncbi:MAG: metal ABC transporter permease [Chitinivibrionia bacterium]|nr:metal ABC transporter permease [Chitinivibrionia bacterium]
MDFLFDFIRHSAQNLVQIGLLPDSFKFAFVINSVICALIIGPVLGAIGTAVVAKRMAFFSNAIGHSALTGIAIGILLGEPVNNPYISLFSFSILFAIFLNFSKNKSGMSHDTLIGVFLAASLAIGASLMMFATRDINIHILDAYLFGSILTASNYDINLLLVIAIMAIAAGVVGFNRTIMSGLNPVLAQVRGVPVVIYDYVFVVLIALITVASVKIVGAILVEALLIIPAAAARNISRSLKSFVAWSVVFATISALTGIIVPMEFKIPIPSGGAIIICATIIFILTLLVKIVRRN